MAKFVCSKCGKELQGDYPMCPYCKTHGSVQTVSKKKMKNLSNCPTCGGLVAKGAKVCPHCGAKQKKKTPWWAYVALFFLFSALVGSIVTRNQDHPSSAQTASANPTEIAEKAETPEDLLAFDQKTWDDFKKLYTAHNDMMDAMTMYSNGELSALSFYNVCEELEEFFGTASLALSYGETEYQRTYVSALQSMALCDQLAAKALIKYLDSFKTSDLSEAQENINQAANAATTIASNRGKLLVLAGLSDEEIRTKIEADTADLD